MQRKDAILKNFLFFATLITFSVFGLSGCGDSGLGLGDESSSSTEVSSSSDSGGESSSGESSSSAVSSSNEMSSSDDMSSSEVLSSSGNLDERLFGCWKDIDHGVGASDWQRVFSLGSDGSAHFEVAEMGDTCYNDLGLWQFESDTLFMLFPESNVGNGCMNLSIPDTVKIHVDSMTSEAIYYNPFYPINKMDECSIEEAGPALSSSSGTSSSAISSSIDVTTRYHADVIVTSSLTDSLWVMDYDGTNVEKIPAPFSVENTIAKQVVISKDSTYYFATYINGTTTFRLWIMDDLQGTNAVYYDMPNLFSQPDMHLTEAGELILQANSSIYEFNTSTHSFDFLVDLWDGNHITEIEFDADGHMYGMQGGEIRQYPSKNGGTFTKIGYDDLVLNSSDPEFTNFNGFSIDAATGAIYIDANFKDAYTEDNLHTWIKLNGFNTPPEAMIPGLDLGTNGAGAWVVGISDSHFYAYFYDGSDAGVVYSSDPGAQNPLSKVIFQGNILDIAIRR